MYLDEGMSAGEIAAASGKSRPTIVRWLNQDGTQLRTIEQANGMTRRRDRISKSKVKDGRQDKSGYFANRIRDRWVRQHRLVAAQALGRELTPSEVVHHCDEDKHNNRPDNLWVFPGQSDHSRYHKTGTIHPDTLKLSEFVMCGDNHGTR